jgi:hypothetical protein
VHRDRGTLSSTSAGYRRHPASSVAHGGRVGQASGRAPWRGTASSSGNRSYRRRDLGRAQLVHNLSRWSTAPSPNRWLTCPCFGATRAVPLGHGRPPQLAHVRGSAARPRADLTVPNSTSSVVRRTEQLWCPVRRTQSGFAHRPTLGTEAGSKVQVVRTIVSPTATRAPSGATAR